LTPHAFWVACVGHNEHTAVRNWGREQWAPALSALASHYGQRLVFLGSPDENEVTEEIRRLMGEHAHSCVNLCDAGDGLDTTVGLVHQSSGYIGRDTGPMHIAAAMDKPVIAVFGGGTWPRFIPAAGRGVVQTVNVPCAGCDWMCHLSESYCVKRVPASAVIDAIAALKRNPEAPLSIQVLAPDEFLSARLVREAAENAREEKRRSAARERALEGRLAQHQAHERSFAELEAGNAELTREIEVRQEAYERVSAELAARNADFEALVQRRDVERHYLRLEREDWAKTQARAEAQIQDLLEMAQELKRQTELSTVEPVGAQQGLLSSSIPRRGVGVLSAMVMVLTRIRAARGRRLAEMRTLAGSFLLLVRTRLRLTHK
jgi:hypothetical protein